MEASESGEDMASVVGVVRIEGALVASEAGVDILAATYNPNALFRTVEVSAGQRSQAVQ